MKKHSVMLVALLLLSAVSTLLLFTDKQQTEGLKEQLVALGFYPFNMPRTLAAVPLMDLQGQSTTLSTHVDSWQLVNFGYMYCPDVCPQNLSYLSEFKTLWQQQMPQAEPVNITHITFDPERDTAEHLAQYLDYIDSDLIGMTGELDNIRQLAQQLNMVFIHGKPDKYGNYFISHSDTLAVLNKQGQFVGLFKAPYDKNTMLQALKLLTAQG